MSDSRIRDEALKLFAKKGYEGTSVREIAKNVDLTASAIYSHFISKEKLYLEILNSCISDFVAGADEVITKHNREGNERILYHVYLYFLQFYMSSSPNSAFMLRNTLFPPDGLQDIIKTTFMEKTTPVNSKLIKIFEQSFAAKTDYYQEHINSYFRFIDGFIIDIAARKQQFATEELERQWTVYWRLIQGL